MVVSFSFTRSQPYREGEKLMVDMQSCCEIGVNTIQE